VLIASALWWFVRPEGPHPYCKFPSKTELEGSRHRRLTGVLPWMKRCPTARATLLSVRAFTERGGERKAVSPMAKAVRGDVARALLDASEPPKGSEEAAAVAEGAGFRVELDQSHLDIVLPGR
jgi:hypothetical protein